MIFNSLSLYCTQNNPYFAQKVSKNDKIKTGEAGIMRVQREVLSLAVGYTREGRAFPKKQSSEQSNAGRTARSTCPSLTGIIYYVGQAEGSDADGP